MSLIAPVVDPIIATPRANRKIRCRIEEVEREFISDNDPRLKLPAEVLHDYYEAEHSRLDRIEDKARGSVFGAAISISVLAAGIGMLGKSEVLADERVAVRLFAALCLLSAMAYLLLSARSALLGYRIGERYVPDMTERPEITSEMRWKKVLLWYIELNRYIASMRANHLTASLDCLRNGLVAIAIFLTISLLASL